MRHALVPSYVACTQVKQASLAILRMRVYRPVGATRSGARAG